MKLDQINVPRLRMAELHAFAEETIKLCKPHGVLGVAVTNVETLFTEFAKSFTKHQASAKDKLELDKKRDKLLSGFFYNIRSAEYFPYSGQAREAVEQLSQLSEKYRHIGRLPQNEETAQIDAMLTELISLDHSQLQDSGMHRWAPLIDKANADFKTAAGEFISDAAQASQQSAATELAPQLTDALNALATMFYAYMTIQPTPELEKSYVELSVLSDTYR